MSLFDELKRLARPYEDEEEDDYEEDFTPVNNVKELPRDRTRSAATIKWSTSTPPPSSRWCW